MLAWASVVQHARKRLAATRSVSWRLSFALGGFVLGVAIHSWMVRPFPIEVLTIILGGLILLSAFSFPRRLTWWLLVLACLTLGLLRYSLSFSGLSSETVSAFVGSEVRLEGTIINGPSFGEERQEVWLDRVSVNQIPREDRVLVWLLRYPHVDYGDRISLRCRLQKPEPFEGFAYDRFLLRVGIVATCSSQEEPFIVRTQDGWWVRSLLYALRDRLHHTISATLPEPHASIAQGLLLGSKHLPDALQADFQRLGISHIFAASGSNVAMVLMVAMVALSYFLTRKKTFWILCGVVVVYVCVAGAESAVVRAGVMAMIVLIAQQSGRASSPRNILLIGATLMLLANPRLLRDDVGFQLSFLATIGLTVLGPWLQPRLAFMPKALGLRQVLASTMAATIFTLPITLFSFGVFSPLSLIANLLVLPLVPFAMAFSAMALLGELLLPGVGAILAAPAWALEQLMMHIVHVLAIL